MLLISIINLGIHAQARAYKRRANEAIALSVSEFAGITCVNFGAPMTETIGALGFCLLNTLLCTKIYRLTKVCES